MAAHNPPPPGNTQTHTIDARAGVQARTMIMATMPERKRTIMKELRMENQCTWRAGRE